MNRHATLLALLAGLAGVLAGGGAYAKMSIVDTKHNLSVTGPGTIKAVTETRICIFCHTPHNANPRSPLWNKNIEGVNYSLYPPYASSTMHATIGGPTGATRLCLSCHDGTIALGEVLQPSKKIAMTIAGGIPAGSSSYIGTSLVNHHPVSFSYYDAAAANAQLFPGLPSGLLFYGNGVMQCTTCHDPHDNSNKKFLAVNNINSGLCTLCHLMDGWDSSDHKTSSQAWNFSAPDPWPRTGPGTDFGWTTVQQNGCESCHAPHNAAGPNRLMNYLKEEDNCYPCHNGNVASTNVQSDFQKPSRHQVDATTIGITANFHLPNESPVNILGHVECMDCHNSHASNSMTASPPFVSGKTAKVSGVDIGGAALIPPANYAQNEYEICFKCHGSSGPQTGMSPGFPIPRVVNTFNKRTAFQTTNPSYHSVVGQAQPGTDVPSIPSIYLPSMTVQDMIYCTDCHDSDTSRSIGGTGPRGSHGSIYRPLVREQYLVSDNTPESPAAYALCYRCHNRTNLLSDVSFPKNTQSGKGGHSGHLGSAVNAPCSICHDPHGVPDIGNSGSHAHLINFDMRYVTPLGTNTYPYFTDNGSRSGSCTLMCHGVAHDGSANFSYGTGSASGIMIRWK